MSIRLRSGGLSFSAYSPSVSESFFYRDVEFDRTRPYYLFSERMFLRK
ncbi:MAG: hypothetical protein ACLRS8_04890 [Parabacteroides merdae]